MNFESFILILGNAVASPNELSQLRTAQPDLLCFAPSEVGPQNEAFLQTSKALAFSATDWGVCQQAKEQAQHNPQLTAVVHKTNEGQINVLAFRQTHHAQAKAKTDLLDKLTEIEQSLGKRIRSNRSLLLAQAVLQKQATSKDQQWLRSLEKKVVQHLAQAPLNVEEFASMACLSKRQLSRRMQSGFGASPAQFIREVQLQLALQNLTNGAAESVIQAALGAGFEHASTFSTLFKQRFGCSPRQYLKS